ncbi:MAG: DUF5615 family PIN-like protein [Crenarchaeota archaeon]|nr:DUF5615 family PIN-like protein [Thermoproteota archaeon]
MGDHGSIHPDDSMRFLANMCISPKTVEFLRSLGYETSRASELGLSTSTDQEIIDYAAKNSMVLITMDLDMGRIIALIGERKPSVILLRLRKPTVENVNKKLSYALNKTIDKLEKGVIVVLEEQRIRIRELPLS